MRHAHKDGDALPGVADKASSHAVNAGHLTRLGSPVQAQLEGQTQSVLRSVRDRRYSTGLRRVVELADLLRRLASSEEPSR